MRRIAATIGIVIATCAPVAAAEPLTPQALRSAIVGHTMYDTGRRFGIRWHWAGYYRSDGRAFARAWWGFGEIRARGSWAIDGGRWCQFWENVDWSEGARNCYRVRRTPDGLLWRHVEGPHVEDFRFERRAGDAFELAP